MCKKSWLKWVVITLAFQCIVVEKGCGQQMVHAINYGVQPGSHTNAARRSAKPLLHVKPKRLQPYCFPVAASISGPKDAEQREIYISNCTETDTLSKLKHIAFLFEAAKTSH